MDNNPNNPHDDCTQHDIAVYWDLSGEVHAHSLQARLHQLEMAAPNPLEPHTALKRAMQQLCSMAGQATNLLVRPIARTAEGRRGYALVRETVMAPGQSQTPLYYNVIAAASVTADGDLVDTQDFGEDGFGAGDLRRLYNHYRTHITPDVMGHWLGQVALRCCQATRLRERGGVFFIPHTHAALWAQVTEAVELAGTDLPGSSNHKIHTLPVVRDARGVAAVMHALQHEVLTNIERIQAELATETLQQRALQTRLKACDTMLEKAAAYQAVLQESTAPLTERIRELQRATTVASLALER